MIDRVSREGNHQDAIGSGAIEQRLACRNCRLAVDIEGPLQSGCRAKTAGCCAEKTRESKLRQSPLLVRM
jgi:hypothetical protein